MVDRSQLDDLVRRRDVLTATKNRLLGKLDSARADVKAVEDECVKRGIPPEKLDATITELNKRLDSSVVDLARRISEAETQIKPFSEVK